MTTERTPDAGAVDASIARLALLADPTLAALHRAVRDHETGIAPGRGRGGRRRLAGYARRLSDLDRLVEAGLATVTYERRTRAHVTGRGPAGQDLPPVGRDRGRERRPSDTTSWPPRSSPRRSPRPPPATLWVDAALAAAAEDRRPGARRGRPLACAGTTSRAAGLAAALAVLSDAGFEPEVRDGSVVPAQLTASMRSCARTATWRAG